MAEYIVKETDCHFGTRQEVVGELIRCGECKHRYIDGENVRFNVCELNHNKVQSDDWFCADAERKDGEME